MSKSIIKIRRKSDNKILYDVINDSCQVHNIYDNDKLIGSFKEWEIDYMDNEFLKDSPYEEIESITEDEQTQTETHRIADEHKQELEDRWKVTKQKAQGVLDETLIERACEWLRNNWRKYINIDADGVVCFGHWENDFRKAMKGD